MSGLNLKGGQPTVTIASTNVKHDKPNKKAKKKSAVGISTPVTLGKPFKVGLLVRRSQVESADLKITKPRGIKLTKEPLNAYPPPGTVQFELNHAFPPRTGSGNPDLDEQWVAFTGTLPRPANPDRPEVSGYALETDLDITTTPIPPHGFQAWTVVLGYDTTSFTTDHYLVASSVLTGEDMRAVPVGMKPAPKKPAAKPAPARSKAKKRKKKR